jgi:hypothetical protein
MDRKVHLSFPPERERDSLPTEFSVRRLWNQITGAEELRFGLMRKLLALIVLALAVFCFFLPLVSVTPPVTNQAEWSSLDLVSYLYQAGLVRSISDLLNFPVEFALAYLLMPIAFYVVTVLRSQRTIIQIAALGIGLVLYGWTRAADSFAVAFFRDYPSTEITSTPHVQSGALLSVLLLIMGCLMFISLSEFLDGKRRRSLPTLTTVRRTREPEFIQAEVISEGEETPRPHLPLRK